MEKPSTPLPPGVVPSESQEDIAAFGSDHKPEKEAIIKEGVFGGSEEPNGGGDRGGGTPEAEDLETAGGVPGGTPPEAWPSPERFHMDLSECLGLFKEKSGEEENGGGGSGATVVPVQKTTSHGSEHEVASERPQSPFVKSTDLRKEAILSGKGGGGQQQTPSKRPMSPLKRFHRVAPSPEPSTASHPPEQAVAGHSLQSSSGSLLDKGESLLGGKGMEESRPGSAPTGREAMPYEQPAVAIVTVNPKAGGEPPAEPLYSTVVKVKTSHRKPPASSLEELSFSATPQREATVIENQTTTLASRSTPEILAALPKLECYEPPVEPTVIITNPATQEFPTEVEPGYDTIDALGESEATDYVEVDDVPRYNASVYKHLRKHDDKGGVQLVSIKGTSDVPQSSSVSFPQGSSQNMRDIHYAAASGNKKLLSEILSALPVTQDAVEMVLGTDRFCKKDGVDVADSEGRTPLLHAVHNDQIQSVKMLAEAGANINAATSDGSTCLHQAAYSGKVEMVALLLSLGANGLKRDNEGRAPLHWCTNNNSSSSVEILLDKVPNLDVNIRDGALMTPLMWAAFHGKPEHIKALLAKGANPSLFDMDGMTAIHWAVQRHDTRALQVLINSESSQFRDNKGKTVMHQAAEQGCAKAISLIKAVRPNSVNDLDADGRSPLHWATACENTEAVRALLANGADPNIRDSSGRTALDYATEKGLHYCALLLTRTEGVEETDAGYQSFLTYGSVPATMGARALQQQEGQPLDPEELQRTLTKEQIMQILTVCRGSWMIKFTNNGKGPLHPRFFRVDPSALKICWSKSKEASGKDLRSDILIGVRSSASPAVFGRKDFDPLSKHKFAFTIFSSTRVLDVVALSSEDFKTWLNGLQLLLHIGSHNASRLLRLLVNTQQQE